MYLLPPAESLNFRKSRGCLFLCRHQTFYPEADDDKIPYLKYESMCVGLNPEFMQDDNRVFLSRRVRFCVRRPDTDRGCTIFGCGRCIPRQCYTGFLGRLAICFFKLRQSGSYMFVPIYKQKSRIVLFQDCFVFVENRFRRLNFIVLHNRIRYTIIQIECRDDCENQYV